MTLSRSLTLFALVTTPLSAFAHPGHGGVFAGFAHPFTGLDHLAAMFAVGLLASQMAGRARWALPGGFVLAALAGALLGFGGWALPGLESVIAASVLALGLMLFGQKSLRRSALPCRRSARAGGRTVGSVDPTYGAAITLRGLAALVVPFGLFHGNAHALEASGTPAWFVVGFVVGTALLHGLGLVVGTRVQGAVLRATGVALAALGGWLMLGTFA